MADSGEKLKPRVRWEKAAGIFIIGVMARIVGTKMVETLTNRARQSGHRVWRTPVERLSISLLLSLFLTTMPQAHSAEYDYPKFTYTVRPALQWSGLLLQTNGWTGADGIFSLPANGIEQYDANQMTDTVFWFSDTYIGQMEYECRHFKRTGEISVLRNSGAVLQGSEPDRDAISFFVGYNDSELDAMVVPATDQASSGSWYWLGDGFLSSDHIQIFAYRFMPDPFRYDGVVLLRLPRDMEIPFDHNDFEQIETPLFNAKNSNGYPVVFGAGVLANTRQAGVPEPDGFIYVYGVEDNPKNRKLIVARVPEDQFDKPSAWRFWGGDGWITDMDLASPVATNVSNELSVSPIRMSDGTIVYVLVYQHNGTSPFICVRISSSPYTGFSPAEAIYKCPERENDPTGKVFTYNAKAHPHLSAPGTLLISYNVNTFNDTGEHIEYGEIYRPRFIELTYASQEDVADGLPVDLGDFEASNPLQNAVVGIDEEGRKVWWVLRSEFGDEDEKPFVEDPTCVQAQEEEEEKTNLVEPDDAPVQEANNGSSCFLSSLL